MSYIPDCRAKYEKDTVIHDLFPPKEAIPENKINPYWYGLLVGQDEEFLRGYDFNTTHTICNLFDNLDIYADELYECGIDVEKIDPEIVNGAYGPDLYNVTFNEETKDTRECKWLEEYSDKELKAMNKHTKLMLTIKNIIIDYIESERDMLVTGMIEDMDDDVHEAAIEKYTNEKE